MSSLLENGSEKGRNRAQSQGCIALRPHSDRKCSYALEIELSQGTTSFGGSVLEGSVMQRWNTDRDHQRCLRCRFHVSLEFRCDYGTTRTALTDVL